MASVVILKAGTTLPELLAIHGDFDDWIIAGLGTVRDAVTVRSIYLDDIPSDYDGISGVVISGSPTSVLDQLPWMIATADWLRGAIERDMPILGICWGHQFLAHTLGGAVGDNPRGAEMCTTTIQLTGLAADDPLFCGLSDPLMVHAAHYHTVLQPAPMTTTLAFNAFDNYHAVRYGYRMWGVQFHPDMNVDIVKAYQRAYSHLLPEMPVDPLSYESAYPQLDQGAVILRRFAALVESL